MNAEDRTERQALAFLDHIAGMGGYRLRPPSYYTVEVMQLLDLAIIRGKEACTHLDPDAMRDQVHAYLFIQAAPTKEVAIAVRAFCRARKINAASAWETFLVEAVEPFLTRLGPEDQNELEQQLEQLGDVAAATVHAVPPPGRKGDRPDPNS